MAGIYIHIPFCRQACSYCNFHFSVNLDTHARILNAMVKELKALSIREKKISTIYFGGGTPSIIPFEYIRTMLNVIYQRFDVDPLAEITLEANPDDINPGKALEWINSGINRLSIGIQSFNDDELKWMNRAHNSQHAVECLSIIRNAGFSNYSADLIFGSPVQDEKTLKKNVDTLIRNEVPHISAYALTVEPKTALYSFIKKGKSMDVDAEKQSEAFLYLMQTLREFGYEHYEISNFCRPGKESRHNSSYWSGQPYYGIGPGAHSFDGLLERKWNVANNALYAASIENGNTAFEYEILTATQLANERIMISLRTSRGLDPFELEIILPGTGDKFRNDAKSLIAKGHLKCIDGRYSLTDEGKLFADGIAAGLFI